MLEHKFSDVHAAPGAAPPYAVAVPVLDGGEVWRRAIAAIAAARPGPARVLVIDSESTDGSAQLAREAGFDLVTIPRARFDHGGTRQMAIDTLSDVPFVVFLTQDAVLHAPDSIATLLAAFADPSVGVAYGRQLPRPQAKPIEAHARLFNYPAQSHVRSAADISCHGIKAAFCSNSFAAYRVQALRAIRGFPQRVIMGEDMCAAARMLLADWRIAYVAEARVVHSHDYSVVEEFRRYFDIGALHADASWLLDLLGRPEGEGLRFVRSEMAYLRAHAPFALAQAALRTVVKYAGYAAGRRADAFPRRLQRCMSMHPRFWRKALSGGSRI